MKNIKKILLLLFVAISLNSYSQTIGDYLDVVHLKNGSKIKGIIIEQIPGQTIKIKTNDGSEFVFKVSEVEKFTRELSNSDSNVSTENKANNTAKNSSKLKWSDNFKKKKKGYFIEIDALAGGVSKGVRITNGIKFGRFGFLGIAAGIEHVSYNRYLYDYVGSEYYSSITIPEVTLNFVYSGDVLNKRITPFYQVELGYGIALDRRGFHDEPSIKNAYSGLFINEDKLYYGGPMGAAQFGIKFKTKRKIVYKIGVDMRVVSSFTKDNDRGRVYPNSQRMGQNNFRITEPNVGVRLGIGF